MSINLDTTQTLVERARARAVAIGIPMNIAVDDGGHLPAFDQMERS
ncbi:MULTISPECIES: heme-binding protein [unclassified Streptomyces]|nr:heme-binding protein [Streptomyces sp. NBC_01001]